MHIPKDKLSGAHSGYGFVEFHSEEDAEYAIKIMNMIKLYGKPIRVNKVHDFIGLLFFFLSWRLRLFSNNICFFFFCIMSFMFFFPPVACSVLMLCPRPLVTRRVWMSVRTSSSATSAQMLTRNFSTILSPHSESSSPRPRSCATRRPASRR